MNLDCCTNDIPSELIKIHQIAYHNPAPLCGAERFSHRTFVALTRDRKNAEAGILDSLKLQRSWSPNDKTLGQMESLLWKK
jgi:hypothetical protein